MAGPEGAVLSEVLRAASLGPQQQVPWGQSLPSHPQLLTQTRWGGACGPLTVTEVREPLHPARGLLVLTVSVSPQDLHQGQCCCTCCCPGFRVRIFSGVDLRV